MAERSDDAALELDWAWVGACAPDLSALRQMCMIIISLLATDPPSLKGTWNKAQGQRGNERNPGSRHPESPHPDRVQEANGLRRGAVDISLIALSRFPAPIQGAGE